ncbi:hypothetical protein DSO57_1007895 [Entomophthora muscae]|uniref:Uncharacterized protein n=1 Tax=Entomophthora muscae TaxID=34485 RepID=A0ACC2SK61_9FUNG|nr:hypothetical protein DSO57_1007895 [Entomophthora muscae]
MPACPAWRLGVGLIPARDLETVLTSVYNWLHLRQRNTSIILPQLDLSQNMLNLQLESFEGDVKGAVIVNWLHSTKTRLFICQVPEPM